MHSIVRWILRVYKKLVYSIAFTPSLMILFSFLLALLVFYFETTDTARKLENSIKILLVRDEGSARLIVTTIIGGIISLTVFSFSMVMVVLNRASASLSPRILPQLVAQKSHQVVLGFYMGTIVFSLILVNNIDNGGNMPALGILLSMILAILSLGLFIYFIHSISQSIQVDNILVKIYLETKKQITEINRQETVKTGILSNDNSKKIVAGQTGFYQIVNPGSLVPMLKKKNLCMEISCISGQFAEAGAILARFNSETVDDKTLETVKDGFFQTNKNDDEEHYFYGLRKISEIAVKSLSPGINDPGTALKAIRYLTILFSYAVHFKSFTFYSDKKGEIRIFKKLPELDTLLRDCITPIRQFAGNSLETHRVLFEFYRILMEISSGETISVLSDNLKALIESTRENLQNPSDRKQLNTIINKIRKNPAVQLFKIPLLPEQT